jgi:hypothetical protein
VINLIGALRWPIADIPTAAFDVRFQGQSGHQEIVPARQLMTLCDMETFKLLPCNLTSQAHYAGRKFLL